MESVRLDIWLTSPASSVPVRSAESVQGWPRRRQRTGGKAHREIRSGDEIVISRPLGRKQRLVVYAVADKHIARAEAGACYEDLTPPPTPEEIEMRRLARLARPFVRPASAGSPDKRERRQLRRMKEGEPDCHYCQ